MSNKYSTALIPLTLFTSIQKVPDSELEIRTIWDTDEKVTSDYIMGHLDKTWQKTTVLNFISRLCERGFLTCHKEGRFKIKPW